MCQPRATREMADFRRLHAMPSLMLATPLAAFRISEISFCAREDRARDEVVEAPSSSCPALYRASTF